LDFVEIRCLAELANDEKQDLSLMLNYERKQNGASNNFLNNNIGGGVSQPKV